MRKQEKFCGARGLYLHGPLIFRVVQFVFTKKRTAEEWRLNLLGRLPKPLKEDKGASAVEYAILVAVIAAVIVGAVTLVGGNLKATFDYIATIVLKP